MHKILHTMIRVGNLQHSLAFYTEILGMKLFRSTEYSEGRFTNTYVGFGEKSDGATIELTHNWDTPAYDLGNGFGHIALEIENAYTAREKIKTSGGKVVREASPMKHGTTVIAFVEDAENYKI